MQQTYWSFLKRSKYFIPQLLVHAVFSNQPLLLSGQLESFSFPSISHPHGFGCIRRFLYTCLRWWPSDTVTTVLVWTNRRERKTVSRRKHGLTWIASMKCSKQIPTPTHTVQHCFGLQHTVAQKNVHFFCREKNIVGAVKRIKTPTLLHN